MSLQEQQDLESRYVMHTFGRKPVDLVRGDGMVVEDDKGNKYLDFIAGIGVCSLGHCHPAVVNAIKSQAETLIHVSNYYYIEGRGQVARRLSGLLNGGAPDDPESWKVFFANSGAEANECSIKLARLYARRRAEELARKEGASNEDARAAAAAAPRVIVTLDSSFHGRTLATLAATAQPAKQEAFQPLPDGFAHTPINDIDALEALFEQRGKEICAVLVECIQGESGVHPCTPEFLQAVRRLTAQQGALFISDEVQTGIFRCGTPFAFQRFGVVPDIVSMAKGIASGVPMGACAALAHVASAFGPGDHGSTFGGSNLAIAAANATLQELSEGYSAKIDEVGNHLRTRLSELPHVVATRGMGLMAAADVDEGVSAPDLVQRGLEAGLLLNATGAHTLRFLPPLVCQKSDVDAMIDRLGKLLETA